MHPAQAAAKRVTRARDVWNRQEARAPRHPVGPLHSANSTGLCSQLLPGAAFLTDTPLHCALILASRGNMLLAAGVEGHDFHSATGRRLPVFNAGADESRAEAGSCLAE